MSFAASYKLQSLFHFFLCFIATQVANEVEKAERKRSEMASSTVESSAAVGYKFIICHKPIDMCNNKC